MVNALFYLLGGLILIATVQVLRKTSLIVCAGYLGFVAMTLLLMLHMIGASLAMMVWAVFYVIPLGLAGLMFSQHLFAMDEGKGVEPESNDNIHGHHNVSQKHNLSENVPLNAPHTPTHKKTGLKENHQDFWLLSMLTTLLVLALAGFIYHQGLHEFGINELSPHHVAIAMWKEVGVFIPLLGFWGLCLLFSVPMMHQGKHQQEYADD